MQEVLRSIRGNAENISARMAEAIELASKTSVDLEAYKASSGLGADIIFARVNALVTGASGFADLDPDRLLLAPVSRLNSLRDHLQNLGLEVEEISGNLRPLESVGIASFDPASGVITGNDGSSVNLRPNLDDVLTSTDAALEAYLVIAGVVQPKGIGTYASASRAMTKNVSETGKLLSELRKQAGELTKKANQLEDKATSVTETHTEAQRLAGEIAAARVTANENEQKILAAATAAEGSRSKATSVDAQVVEYEDKFKAFQTLLDTREAELKNGTAALAALDKSLREKENQSTDLLETAAKMLGGATIAGLSVTFHDKAVEVNGQLNSARLGFYASIAFLLCSILISLNLFTFWGKIHGLPPLPTISPQTQAGTLAIQTLAALGSRALVILPALLLAGFAAHRHSALFRLREEYSHKKALAVSVQGFKEQAPTFQEPIAAAVFQELLLNPANSIDRGVAENKENGFVARLIRPVVDRSLKQMFELRDGAVPK